MIFIRNRYLPYPYIVHRFLPRFQIQPFLKAATVSVSTSDNSVYSNTIVNPLSEEEVINNEDQDNNTFEDNNILSSSAFFFAPSSPFSSFHVYSMAREN